MDASYGIFLGGFHIDAQTFEAQQMFVVACVHVCMEY